MDISSGNLRHFFERIKSINLWQRIFNWRPLKILSYDAYDEFKNINQQMEGINIELTEKKSRINELEIRISEIKNSNQKLENRISALEKEISTLNNEKSVMEKKIAKYEQSEETRAVDYKKNITEINSVKKGLEEDRQKLHDERLREKEEEFEQMKQTWKKHQDNVESAIKNICRNYLIDYVDKVPFRGNPDNTLKIADEFIIFDAKSPAGDDLNNFPRYLKIQTESVKKYTKHDNVKKDIFLVIPSNTLETVKQFTYNLGDYNVFIVTIDSLEPIILSLKKIEDYEFAEKLSPEERENICRIIGKFAHTTKRKILIDYFFSYQFLELLSKYKTDLPHDLIRIVDEFEKAEKLNPPQEKRAKQILTEDLIKESERLYLEAMPKLIEKKDKD
jgi:hypothetical protein